MAKDFYKSHYAVNKKSKAIIYKSVDGSIFEVTYQKVSEYNPDFTQSDYELFKTLSDEMYQQEARRDKVEADHTVTIYDNEEYSAAFASVSVEDLIFEQENQRATKIYEILDSLTSTQKRRLLLNKLHGLSIRKIAEIEGVSQKAVWESIQHALKKMNKL